MNAKLLVAIILALVIGEMGEFSSVWINIVP
jgi:hypothetical protein